LFKDIIDKTKSVLFGASLILSS